MRFCQRKKFISPVYQRALHCITYPHSRLSSSDSSIFLNLESRNALVNAYSAIPALSGCASKVPMQPLRRCPRPERDDLLFQVTNKGLRIQSELLDGKLHRTENIPLYICEFHRNWCFASQSAVQCIKRMEAVFW